MKTHIDHHRNLADIITRLFWDNFLRTEPALAHRDVIAIELDKSWDAALEMAARQIETANDETTRQCIAQAIREQSNGA